MSARRLNDSEKKKIVQSYRESSETAVSLAEQFGVSNTTISRILKAGIDSDEYDRLIQQKRRGPDLSPLEIEIPVLELQQEPPQAIPAKVIEVSPPIETQPIIEASTPSGRRIRRRTTAETTAKTTAKTPVEPVVRTTESQGFERLTPPVSTETPIVLAYPVFTPQRANSAAPKNVGSPTVDFESSTKPTRKVIQIGVAKQSEAELLGEDEEDLLPPVTEEIAAILEEDFDEDDDDDDQDDDSDDEDDDDDEMEPGEAAPALHVQKFMQVLPLEQASIPRVCYLVVDRSAELILRPLKDFGEIGQVPPGRDQVMTLPIFDNPRVAKRFSNARTERVIKVPDSQVFYKTAEKLRSKGITYLYIDGQLYSL